MKTNALAALVVAALLVAGHAADARTASNEIVSWVDVTDRLMTHPHVRVSGWGIHFDGGVLPAGESTTFGCCFTT